MFNNISTLILVNYLNLLFLYLHKLVVIKMNYDGDKDTRPEGEIS